MNHRFRFPSAAVAAVVCAFSLSVSAVDASARDTLDARSGGANVFRAARLGVAQDDGHPARAPRRERYAAPAERSPFDMPDTRPLRVSGDTLAPQPSPDPREHDPAWPANRVALGAGGSDSLGRALPAPEQRAQNWNEYLRANGSHAAGRGGTYAPTRPFDAARGAAPNPFDPSVSQPETRTFYDNGAGSHCTATGGAGTSRSSCNIAW
ncbi:hypothetical protein WS58_02385 [Burkholderia pseudomultivorans]|uniref:hypothetical protein n=1 Tax=Burkholderia pseudomultivorans TaxID=1207504 RepID=UPI000753240C|nr:hypothetical protein [Burkholderia pseudomultivorans]KVC37041.1 hypothetical protein WS58_02385 [Burkholderia pseudomultivorans]